jgi:hypothetical protein
MTCHRTRRRQIPATPDWRRAWNSGRNGQPSSALWTSMGATDRSHRPGSNAGHWARTSLTQRMLPKPFCAGKHDLLHERTGVESLRFVCPKNKTLQTLLEFSAHL